MPLGPLGRAGRPHSRRQRRGARISAAIGILSIASAVLIAAIVTRSLAAVTVGGILAVLAGWVSLRLAWTTVVSTRLQHVTERTDLAHAYRDLFASRAVESSRFSQAMSLRLGDRDRAVHRLEQQASASEHRAVEAEISQRTLRRQLHDATDRIGVMEDLVTRQLEREVAGARTAEEERRSKPPLRGGRRAGPRGQESVPEWVALEPDPVAALMAWEQHADERARANAEEGEGRLDHRHRAGGA